MASLAAAASSSSSRKRTADASRDTDTPSPTADAMIVFVRHEEYDSNVMYVVQRQAAERLNLLDEWNVVYRHVSQVGIDTENFNRLHTNAVARLMWASTLASKESDARYFEFCEHYSRDSKDCAKPLFQHPLESMLPPFEGGALVPIDHVVIFHDDDS